ncbi:MAG: S24 family peptidase [Thermodesulfobacteriota bacterium]
MTTLGERIKIIRGDTSREKFAPLLGVSKNTIVNYETDARTPDTNFVVRLLELYPDTNPTWLLTGDGPRHIESRHRDTAGDMAKHLLLGDKDAALRRSKKTKEIGSAMRAAIDSANQVWHEIGGEKLPEPQTAAEKQLATALAGLRARYEAAEFGRLAAEQQADEFADGADYIKIPRYEVAASAGGGAVIHSEQVVDYLSFRAEWVRNTLGVSVRDLALISVIGDSMEPTLSEGDVVLLDMTTKSVLDGSIYALQLNGGLLVKRIQRRLDGSVVVKSDNPRYDTEEVSEDKADRLKIIGRVVWVGRRL